MEETVVRAERSVEQRYQHDELCEEILIGDGVQHVLPLSDTVSAEKKHAGLADYHANAQYA